MMNTELNLLNSLTTDGDTTDALQAYRLARFNGWVGQLWAALTGRPRKLNELPARPASQQHYRGTRTVALREITGTEEKSEDFDRDFNPLAGHTQQRWMGLFTAMAHGRNVPPVELTKLGQAYYVRDGHHRLSVAHALGQDYIEAVVTEWN